MRIVAVPAFINRAVNPYTALLYSAMVRAGATVYEAYPWKLVRAKQAVLHIHWPDYFFSAPNLGEAVLKSLALVLLVSVMRARKAPVIWTIHNLRGHEQWHARLETRMWRWFVARIDGYIALTAGGQTAALARFPSLRNRPGFVIPHGHYRDEYPDDVTRVVARRALALPPAARVILFLGTIRPYKDVPTLIDAFRLVPDDGWRLVIAGRPTNVEIERQVRQTAHDARICLHLDFVPRERVQLYMRATDLVVVPYRDVLNSGSALLALSFDRPVLVAERGAMAELQTMVGREWVQTYRGDLTALALVAAMTWAETTPRDRHRLFRDLEWDEIARQTVLAYDAVRLWRATATAGRR